MRPFGALFDKVKGAENGATSDTSHGAKNASNKQVKRLPVLIFPGFMSSALEVKESPLNGWIGKRVWLNISSVGFSGIYFGSALKANEDKRERGEEYDEELHQEYEEERECKSTWLRHFKLMDDLQSDPEGIEARPMKGLEAVNFLDPNGIIKHVSWVFQHVTTALMDVGYVEGHDLEAAPYDWRIPPCMLESRDSVSYCISVFCIKRLSWCVCA